jgi:hypothetical protein
VAGAIVIFVAESISGAVPSLAGRIALVIGWYAGILGGGAAALFMGRRWAPVAWVVAITLFAFIAIQIPQPWWMMAGAVVAALAGGFAAIKLMKGSYARPVMTPKIPTPGM